MNWKRKNNLRYLLTVILLIPFGLNRANGTESSAIIYGSDIIATDSLINIRRPIVSGFSVEWGVSSAFDTYLTPLRYSGQRVSVAGEWQKVMRQGNDMWNMRFDAMLSSAFMHYQYSNSTLYDLRFLFSWAAFRKFNPAKNIILAVGPGASLDFGTLYLPSNSNNPASARASADITINLAGVWKTHISKLPITISDTFRLPTAGIFFAPQYGESYYEIYLGNHNGLVNFGWWGNHFQASNLLAADFALGITTVRLGYRYDITTSWINNINTRITSHSLVVGVQFDSIRVSPRSKISLSDKFLYPY